MPTLLYFFRAKVLGLLPRNYIANNYESIRESPASITIRELEYSTPAVVATFDYGVERKVSLNDKSEADIETTITELESSSQDFVEQVRI